MAYKHILSAVDLSHESKFLVEKAVSIARSQGGKLSLIHIDMHYSGLYSGLIDLNMGEVHERLSEETKNKLTDLAKSADYPIAGVLSTEGDLAQVLEETVKKYSIDLLVCGHHQDLWGKFMSSARQIINTLPIDMLIVPLRDNERPKK